MGWLDLSNEEDELLIELRSCIGFESERLVIYKYSFTQWYFLSNVTTPLTLLIKVLTVIPLFHTATFSQPVRSTSFDLQ